MTTATIRIIGFSGSLRAQSYNTAALEAIRGLLPEGVELEIISLADLPHYNEDLETDEPETVRHFKAKLRQADALLIATPEYNGSLPGVLKNALDWASRPHGRGALLGKPTAILGVGGRGGAARAQQHLRAILSSMRVALLDKPEVAIPTGREKFDEQGILLHDETRVQLANLLAEVLNTISASRENLPLSA